MKFSVTLTFDVPDGTTFQSEFNAPQKAEAYSAPFEDQLVPIPGTIPLPGDPTPFRTMATGTPSPGLCPIHHEPWKHVPAGISARTGERYEAFISCPVRGCRERPAVATPV